MRNVISTYSFSHEWYAMPNDSIVKKVFILSKDMHEMGFKTWYGKICELGRKYSLDIKEVLHSESTKRHIKSIVKSSYT